MSGVERVAARLLREGDRRARRLTARLTQALIETVEIEVPDVRAVPEAAGVRLFGRGLRARAWGTARREADGRLRAVVAMLRTNIRRTS